MSKVCVLALDGWTWRAVDPLLAAGVLPRVRGLIEGGGRGVLQSTFPPVTACAWTGCFTGCGPGKSGVFDFQTYDRSGRRFVVNNASRIRAATLWEMLDAAGRDFISVNVPMTYPPKILRGVTVSGMMAPAMGRSAVHPPEVFDKYISPLEGYGAIDTRFEGQVRPFVDRQIKLEELRTELVLRLMRDRPWDVLAVQFHAADAAQHFLWHGVDPEAKCDEGTRSEMRRLFSALDGCVGRVLDALDDGVTGDGVTVLAISDHGFGAQDGNLFLNSWLVKRGLLRLRGAGVRARRMANAVLGARLASRLEKAAKKIKRQQSFGGRLLSSRSSAWAGEFDLEGSSAVAVGSYYAGIYLAGDEPERRRLAERLKGELDGGAVSDRRGNAIAGAFLPEEVYTGPFVAEAPDLTVKPRDGLSIANAATKGRAVYLAGEPYGPKYTGCHRPEGIVIVAGPGSTRGILPESNLVDVCPTVLALLGVPVPAGLDGVVQGDWFEGGLSYTHGEPVSSGTAPVEYSAEDRARVEQRLSELGYL